ncbi:MAG: hypothetical protein ACM3X5_02300, partial [Bacillota bacterium]
MVSPTPLDRFRVSSSRFDMGRVTDREAWEAVRQLRARALHARHDVAENVELADDGYDNALNT